MQKENASARSDEKVKVTIQFTDILEMEVIIRIEYLNRGY